MKTEDFDNKKTEATKEESSSLFDDAYKTISHAANEVAEHPGESAVAVAAGLAAIALARRGHLPELGPALKSVGADAAAFSKPLMTEVEPLVTHVPFPSGGNLETKVKAMLDAAHSADLSHTRFSLGANNADKVKAILDSAQLGPGHVQFDATAGEASKIKAILKESERK